MLNQTIKKKLIEDLNNLPVDSQIKVQEFAHALMLSHAKGKPGKDVIKFAGIMKEEEADAILNTIEQGCEKVDIDEW